MCRTWGDSFRGRSRYWNIASLVRNRLKEGGGGAAAVSNRRQYKEECCSAEQRAYQPNSIPSCCT